MKFEKIQSPFIQQRRRVAISLGVAAFAIVGAQSAAACSMLTTSFKPGKSILKKLRSAMKSAAHHEQFIPYIATITPPKGPGGVDCSGFGSIVIYFDPYNIKLSNNMLVFAEHVGGQLPEYSNDISQHMLIVDNNKILISLYSNTNRRAEKFNFDMRLILADENGRYLMSGAMFNLSYSGDENRGFTRYSEHQKDPIVFAQLIESAKQMMKLVLMNRIRRSIGDDSLKIDTDNLLRIGSAYQRLKEMIDTSNDLAVRYLKIDNLRLNPERIYPEYRLFITHIKQFYWTVAAVGRGGGKEYGGYSRRYWNENAVFESQIGDSYSESLKAATANLINSQ